MGFALAAPWGVILCAAARVLLRAPTGAVAHPLLPALIVCFEPVINRHAGGRNNPSCIDRGQSKPVRNAINQPDLGDARSPIRQSHFAHAEDQRLGNRAAQTILIEERVKDGA